MAILIPLRSGNADHGWRNRSIFLGRPTHRLAERTLAGVTSRAGRRTLFVPAVRWYLCLAQTNSPLPPLAFDRPTVSYIGYLTCRRAARFLLRDLQHAPLGGLWLFDAMQSALDRLESAHYDCFPSGHTELTIIAWWGSRLVSKGWFRAYLVYTLCIIFATVYLRYHYTVDVLAGVLTAAC
jgi:membrane-associated phospholipid phosphatase